MIQLGDALASLEGNLNSAVALVGFINNEDDPVAAGLVGVIAGIKTSMTMIEQLIEPTTTEEGPCTHPADQIVVRRAGGRSVRLCQACNEFID